MRQPEIVQCLQSPEDPTWVLSRIGHVTSSRVADAIGQLQRKSGTKNKGDETAACEDLRYQLACEILTGRLAENFVSFWMKQGKEREPLARAAYEFACGTETYQVGFAFHPTINMAGCSPDACVIGFNGGAEFKCPKTETHLRYLIAGVVPEEYKPQMYWQMAVMGWDWNDFVSHEPNMKKSAHRTLIVRLHRDDKIIADMEEKVMRFNDSVQKTLEKLNPDYIAEQLEKSIAQVYAPLGDNPELIDVP